MLGEINSIHLQKWCIGLKDDFEIEVFSINSLKSNVMGLEGINIVSGFHNEGKSFIGYLKMISSFRKAAKAFNADITHYHYITSYGGIAQLLNSKIRVGSVWGSDVFEFPKKSFVHKAYLKFILRSTEEICSSSISMKKELKLYSDQNIHVIPFGVDVEKFCPNPMDKKRFTIGTVKHLEKIYGIDRLLLLVEELKNRNVDFQCLVYGDGSEKKELMKQSTLLGIQGLVEFRGRIENHLVPDTINEFDLFCMFSRAESFGVAAVESLACGVPVFATNVGGIPEVVLDGKTGFSEEFDVVKIADNVVKLKSDKAFYDEISNNGRIHVLENFNWSKNLQLQKELYWMALSKKNVK